MTVTTKELRIQPGKVIEQVAIGQEIIVTYRGRPLAKIVPFLSSMDDTRAISIFGMWKNHDQSHTVEDQVRELRKGRQF
jgi:prevent-host-death family protein